VRSEWGTRIREAFVAEPGSVIISADYSQIELRILAHLSEDETLVDAFLRGMDVHSRTASEIFDVPIDEVTKEQRRVAKTVNFGVIYGQTPFGLSQGLGISRWEAENYITNYFVRHPGVQQYQTDVLARATDEGYVQTMFGRKRPMPELRSRRTRQLGERMAVNTPIQGSAADIIKLAMIRIDRDLRERGLRSRMILQVHDELVFEAPKEETDTVSALVREGMQGAAELKVPLEVDLGTGDNWAQAH
jgi:DNA polymerase-1